MASKVDDEVDTGVGQKTLVYLVRHGETDWNVERRFQGQLDVELSKNGLLQADALAQWLAVQPVTFSAIYSSDLKRAALTARIIGERLDLVPRLDPALREINVGEWQGLVASEIEDRFPGELEEWHEKIDTFTLPGGESIPLVQKRVFAAYQQMVERHPGEAIIIVSHGAALTALMAALHDWDLVDTWHTKRARMGNTHVSVAVFDHEHSKHEILLMDSGEHLEAPGDHGGTLDARPNEAAP
ncbi:MAG: histidine phosphatase family protein [Chloroflexota bacterium]